MELDLHFLEPLEQTQMFLAEYAAAGEGGIVWSKRMLNAMPISVSSKKVDSDPSLIEWCITVAHGGLKDCIIDQQDDSPSQIIDLNISEDGWEDDGETVATSSSPDSSDFGTGVQHLRKSCRTNKCCHRLYIRGIYFATRSQLFLLLRKYGDIQMLVHQTKKKFALVEYTNCESASNARSEIPSLFVKLSIGLKYVFYAFRNVRLVSGSILTVPYF